MVGKENNTERMIDHGGRARYFPWYFRLSHEPLRVNLRAFKESDMCEKMVSLDALPVPVDASHAQPGPEKQYMMIGTAPSRPPATSKAFSTTTSKTPTGGDSSNSRRPRLRMELISWTRAVLSDRTVRLKFNNHKQTHLAPRSAPVRISLPRCYRLQTHTLLHIARNLKWTSLNMYVDDGAILACKLT